MALSSFLRRLALAGAALAACGLLGGLAPASAQDAPKDPVAPAAPESGPADDADIAARLRRLKDMTPEERARLKQALQRFRNLDAEQRRALRAKAATIGEDRLRALGGRDIQPLKARHVRVRKEVALLKQLLDFDHATRALSAAEKQYVEHELSRRFPQAVRSQILAPNGEPFDVKAFQAKTPAERKAFFEERFTVWLYERMDESEREAYRVATAREQGRIRRRMLEEFRDRYAQTYVRNFQAVFLTRFQQFPQERRDRQVLAFQRRARWFEMSRVLEREVQVAPEVLRRLRQLPATDWRQVRDRYEALREAPLHRRRIELETLIDELHGKAATDREQRRRKP